jgi:hypothetical protein
MTNGGGKVHEDKKQETRQDKSQANQPKGQASDAKS